MRRSGHGKMEDMTTPTRYNSISHLYAVSDYVDLKTPFRLVLSCRRWEVQARGMSREHKGSMTSTSSSVT